MVKPRGKMGKMKKHVTVRKLGEKERASDNFELLCFVISESETERLQQGFFFCFNQHTCVFPSTSIHHSI